MTTPARWLVIISSIGLLLLTGCGTLEANTAPPAEAPPPDGVAWFGFGDDSFYPTGGGVNRFDGQTWQVFDQSTGLPVSDDVHLLTVDPEGRPAGRPSDITVSPSGEVWIVTEAGIGHLGPSGWVRHGRMWEGDAYGIAVSPDGSVWLATSQGAVHVSIP